jgi:putative DNA primase/helicase
MYGRKEKEPGVAGVAPEEVSAESDTTENVRQPGAEGNSDLLTHALRYAESGWDVFPAPPGEKRSHKSAKFSNGSNWGKTRDPEEIKRDWRRWPDANVGIATGAESGIFVVDVDTAEGHGVDGLASMKALEEFYGQLPVTRMAESPTGSQHYYFIWPEAISIKNKTEIAPGIDVRGEGGMVIAPPSVTTKGTYRWLNEDPPTDAPRWLINLAIAGDSDEPHLSSDMPEADPDLLAAALALIPNDDLDWESWNNIGLAFWRGTGGKNFEAFDAWSQKSKKYDVGVRVSVLDEEVERVRRRLRPDEDDNLQGQALLLSDIEPWSDAVLGDQLISDIVVQIRRHVILTEEQAIATALWIVHAHALDSADHSPRLHVASPLKRCGKTVLLSCINPLVPRALGAENITVAALFRVIAMARPTLLVDEADAFLTENEELRGLLNAGHGRSGMVIRLVGDGHTPRAFSVWGAVVIAGIGRIPETIEDRSITIHLRRKLKSETIVRLKNSHRDQLAELGRKSARWVADHTITLREADPVLPECLGDRQQDNWRPLIAIADAIDPSWGDRARAAAIKIAAEDAFDEETASVMALADVASIFERAGKGVDRLPSEQIVARMFDMKDRPWPEWRRGQPLTQSGLARLLKPFGIGPQTMRFAPRPASTQRGYWRGPIDDAKARFVDRPDDGAVEAEDPM